ncbi:adipocyte plasma membrane-associated protein Hemomucin isoform X1 [Halyomorpha halys]|uniref:adipocyte plasma membrane-associated protein Hemomucin isoform X1 n=1 Tax=Halyomorpha halys TaxID=286706 RepID=UPI0006D51732|nr:adipocyte plasma membrane-associated protein-like isoform X1 [Halyomorpha halys]
MSEETIDDSCSVLSSITQVIAVICIVVPLICFMPGLPPDMTFSYHKLTVQPVTLNGKLNNAEKLFLNQVKGPEDVVVHNNELYTSSHGGSIKKLSNGKLISVIKFGKDCNEETIMEEDICGRPLGFRFNRKGLLYAADAYYGIYKANLSNGDVEAIVSKNVPIDGFNPMIPNSIALSKKTDDFFWTDSSTTHLLKDGLYTFLGDGNGRLLKYNSVSKKNEVLLKNLHFPNGVALSADESFLIVAETFGSRLLKYNLKGSNTGKVEVFSNLPGFPDNVDYVDGRFIVSIVMKPDKFIETLSEWPIVKKFAARTMSLVEYIVELLDSLYPSIYFKKINHWIGHFESLHSIAPPPPGAIVLFIDNTGRLVQTLSTNDNNIGGISSMTFFQGHYYLGSPFNPFLARVKAS